MISNNVKHQDDIFLSEQPHIQCLYLLHESCVLFFSIVVLFQAGEHFLQELANTEIRSQHTPLVVCPMKSGHKTISDVFHEIRSQHTQLVVCPMKLGHNTISDMFHETRSKHTQLVVCPMKSGHNTPI